MMCFILLLTHTACYYTTFVFINCDLILLSFNNNILYMSIQQAFSPELNMISQRVYPTWVRGHLTRTFTLNSSLNSNEVSQFLIWRSQLCQVELIDKLCTIFLIIEQVHRTFFFTLQSITNPLHILWRRLFPLQEPTISSHNLIKLISRQLCESATDINNGIVRLMRICDAERDTFWCRIEHIEYDVVSLT